MSNSDQKENNYSGHYLILDNGIFLHIKRLYDDEKMWQKFGTLLIIKTIGCFTTHSDAIVSQGIKGIIWKGSNLAI